jgi:heterodisulfide reductase subunit A2
VWRRASHGAIDHAMSERQFQVRAGSIIVATGYDTLDPAALTRFGYGRYPNVFTALEFERLSNATGPTGGQILMKDAKTGQVHPSEPESVAIVHCVGSRDANFHEYCSRVCCMYALKYTHLIKEKVGHDTRVYDFYIDMRCFGKGYEEFFQRCQQEGTRFVRGKVARITDHAEPGPAEEGQKLVAIAEDTLLGRGDPGAGGHGDPVHGHGGRKGCGSHRQNSGGEPGVGWVFSGRASQAGSCEHGC